SSKRQHPQHLKPTRDASAPLLRDKGNRPASGRRYGWEAPLAQFKINTEANSITPLTARTFGELGFKERSNLQEWIAKEPSCLGEELLVIPEGSLVGFPTLTNRSTCLPSTSKAPSFS